MITIRNTIPEQGMKTFMLYHHCYSETMSSPKTGKLVVGFQFHCTTQYLFLISLNYFFHRGVFAVAIHSIRGMPDLGILKTSGKPVCVVYTAHLTAMAWSLLGISEPSTFLCEIDFTGSQFSQFF
jgi:hypothetical protein